MISVDAMPGLSAYIATKKGLAGFSQSLAMEVGEQGVRVIPFVPGMVDTPGIRGVASGLAPRLGLSEEQFLHMPLHTAFDGLMPPAFSGAATAFLIARLADEFHGEMVTGYEVLERAGLINQPLYPSPWAITPLPSLHSPRLCPSWPKNWAASWPKPTPNSGSFLCSSARWPEMGLKVNLGPPSVTGSA